MAAEFVIVNLGSEAPKVGSSYTILGVAESEAAARTLLGTLPATAASKVVILQKVAVVRRMPSVKLEDLQEDLFPAQP